MKNTFWVVETAGPYYLGVDDNHEFVWSTNIIESIKFASELSAMTFMFAFEKLKPEIWPAAPYAAEHVFFD